MIVVKYTLRRFAAYYIVFGSALGAWLLPRPCDAAAPRTLNIQGVLFNPSTKAPKPDGSYTVAFRLYNAATGGTLLWTEPSETVAVSGGRGIFAAVLGAPTPFGTLAFDQPYYVEVQVSGEAAPMTPRLALAAVPYALHADAAPLALPFSGSLSSATTGIAVANTGSGHAISADGSGGGVGGSALYAHSSTGIGVISDTTTTDGNTVLFQNGSGDLIKAFTNGGSKLAFEVQNTGLVSTLGGVSATSSTGVGVVGTGASNGLEGHTANGAASGVYGQNDGSGYGVAGRSKTGVGLLGESTSDGFGNGGDGIEGIAHVIGRSGVYGHNDQSGSSGVYGAEFGPNGVGVTGSATQFASSVGVRGLSASGTGVYGSVSDAGGIGVYGENTATGADAWLGGQYGYTDPFGGGQQTTPVGILAQGGPNGAGIVAQGSASKVAGLFLGEVHVTGALYGNDKHFLIDDPADPANKLLQHTCVESPDMMNIYNGNATTDANGDATVALPAYFDALNRDFRYQLTVIGQFAQAIVSSKVVDNHFSVKTDKPNVEVSWQVTGIRNDAYAKTHTLPAEIDKGTANHGRFVNPEVFGKPASMALNGTAIQNIAASSVKG